MQPPTSISERRPSVLTPDEISLPYLWRILREGWRWLAAGSLVGILTAATYLGIAPQQYEASGVVKVGQVLSGGNVVTIEPATQVVGRLGRRAFQDDVLKRLGWLQDGRANLYRSSLKAIVRNELIEFQVRATSADDARRAAAATVEKLTETHREEALARIVSAKARAESANITEEREIETRLAKLDRLAKEIPASSYNEILLLLSLQSLEKERLRILRREAVATVPQLRDDTVAVEPVAVSDDPVFPKARRMLLLGAMGGLLAGLLYVVLRGSWRNGQSG